MEPLDSIVIGAGQAGLSASYHLQRLGLTHLVLDADPTPSGAWQHRWDSLTMTDVHGVAALPDSASPGKPAGRANIVVPAYFAAYERDHDLPVVRSVRVDRVTDDDGVLTVHDRGRSWPARTIVNATGTWSRPFVPHYPGIETFRGEQLHTVDYPGSPAANPSGAPTTSRRRPAGRPSPWSRSGSAGGCRRRASSASPGWRCASRSGPPSGSAPTNGVRCSPGSSRAASASPAAPSSRSTCSCGRPVSGPR